mmetsp:Transcript_10014/g.23968  ORF Transcript_10014/g.23968 Transcript_10014/m.23968 type:complete len:269 (+) Transcript_10014:35-841(+)
MRVGRTSCGGWRWCVQLGRGDVMAGAGCRRRCGRPAGATYGRPTAPTVAQPPVEAASQPASHYGRRAAAPYEPWPPLSAAALALVRRHTVMRGTPSWYLRSCSRMSMGTSHSSSSSKCFDIISLNAGTERCGVPSAPILPPSQYACSVYCSSHVNGVVTTSTPPGLTSAGRRSTQSVGRGTRHTTLASSMPSNAPPSWPGVAVHASPCSKRVRALASSTLRSAGSLASCSSLSSTPSMRRRYGLAPLSRSCVHARTNAREYSTPTTSP